MSIHNRLQPHHHLAIWLLAAVVAFAAAVTYTGTRIDTLYAQSGPSEKTKKFFGFDGRDDGGEGEKFEAPAACKMQSEQEKMQELSKQMQSLSNELSTLYSQNSGSTPEEQAARNQKAQELQQKISALQTDMQTLQQKFQAGPTDECKRAIVAQALSHMRKMNAKMDGKFLGTLGKVEAALNRVEAALQKLQAAGVDQATIDSIKADIANIKTQVAVLKDFFNSMKSSLQNWISVAESNPSLAFEQMQKGSFMDESKAQKAATAADSMVDSFQHLVTTLDGLSE